ncbi:MAG: TonB-dependent receptor [Gammaproteobacteria bacterium]|nr:TonB-dependent receptor [Gammaproteobacteria bacterium]
MKKKTSFRPAKPRSKARARSLAKNRVSIARRTTAAVAALMSAQMGVATAQEGPQLEEVIVTATKRETSIKEVPLAISAFTGEFTREANLNDVKDIIVWTPGITGNSQDSFIDAVSIRGILTNDFGVGGDPSVGFFKNNLYQGRNGPVNSSLYDMERVEALRGPQGFLFGRNTIGGAISFHTKQPIMNQNSGYMELDVGERNHTVFEGAVNISSSDSLAFRVAGYFSKEDGYIDNLFTPEDDELMGHEKSAIRISTLYEQDNFSAMLTLEYEDRDGDGSVYRGIQNSIGIQTLDALFAGSSIGGVNIGGGDTDINQDFGFDGLEDDSRVHRTGLHLEWDLGGMILTSTTGYTDHNYLYIEDFDGTPLQINDYLQDQSGEYFQQELRLTSDTEGPLSWYAGASYYKEDIDAFFSEKSSEAVMCAYYFAAYYPSYYPTGADALAGCQYYYGDPLTGELIEDNRAVGKYTGWAVYANMAYEFSDQWDMELGLRYSEDEKEFQLEAFPISSVLGPFWALGFTTAEPLTETKTWDDLTPRMIVRYRPDDDWMFYGSVTSGYKSGGFGTFAAESRSPLDPLGFGELDLTNDRAGPSDFDPETVLSTEFGVKGTLADGMLRFDANVYNYDYEDLQVVLTGDGGGIIVDNVGEADGQGLEASMQWLINENWDLRFSYAYTSTEIYDAQEICPGDNPDACEGEKLGYVPESSYSGRLGFQYPVSGGNIRASLEMFGQDETNAIPISTDPAEKIDAYTEWTLRVGYESAEGWGVNAYIENLTDETYYDGMFAGGGILPAGWFNPSRPRTIGVTLFIPFGGE